MVRQIVGAREVPVDLQYALSQRLYCEALAAGGLFFPAMPPELRGLGALATKSPANYKLSDDLWTGGTSTTQGMPTPAQVAAAVQALAPPGVGEGQTWQNVAGSRSIGTAYQNTTGRPIALLVLGSSSGPGTVQVSGNGVTFVAVAKIGGQYHLPASLIIPTGHYYKVVGTTIEPGMWCELR